jgi:hypothetical protein
MLRPTLAVLGSFVLLSNLLVAQVSKLPSAKGSGLHYFFRRGCAAIAAEGGTLARCGAGGVEDWTTAYWRPTATNTGKAQSVTRDHSLPCLLLLSEARHGASTHVFVTFASN